MKLLKLFGKAFLIGFLVSVGVFGLVALGVVSLPFALASEIIPDALIGGIVLGAFAVVKKVLRGK